MMFFSVSQMVVIVICLATTLLTSQGIGWRYLATLGGDGNGSMSCVFSGMPQSVQFLTFPFDRCALWGLVIVAVLFKYLVVVLSPVFVTLGIKPIAIFVVKVGPASLALILIAVVFRTILAKSNKLFPFLTVRTLFHWSTQKITSRRYAQILRQTERVRTLSSNFIQFLNLSKSSVCRPNIIPQMEGLCPR